MAERDQIRIDSISGVAKIIMGLGRSFFRDRCCCRSDGSFGGATRQGSKHTGAIFGHGFRFINGKRHNTLK